MSACLCPASAADGTVPDHPVCWVPGNSPNPDCSCCRKTQREINRLRKKPATIQPFPETKFDPDQC